MRFIDIVRADAGIFRTGNEYYLRIVRRQAVFRAKVLNIGEGDLSLAGDDDALPRAVYAGAVQGSEVVNGREIVRSDIVIAAGRGVLRVQSRAGLRVPQHTFQGMRAEVIQAANGADEAAPRLRKRRRTG